MTVLTTLIKEDSHFQDLSQIFGQVDAPVTDLSPSIKVAMIVEKYAQSSQQLLLVINNLCQADKLGTDLLQFVDAEKLYKYPVQDVMTEEFSTQGPQLISEHVRTLAALARSKKGLLIVPLNSLKKWLAPVEIWQSHQITLRVDEDIDVDQFPNKLANMGYKRGSVISYIDEFSLREGIIGIFPLIGEPIRIGLFDAEVDSIRDFDVETRHSKDNIEEVDITATSGYIVIEEVISHLKGELEITYENTRPKIDKSVRSDLKETYESFKLFEDTYFDYQILRCLVVFIYETPPIVISYFQKDVVIAVNELNRIKETEESLTIEFDSFISNTIESGNGFIRRSFIKYDDFGTLTKGHPVAYLSLFTTAVPIKLNRVIKFSYKPTQQFYERYNIVRSEFQRHVNQNYHTVVLIGTGAKVRLLYMSPSPRDS